MMALAMVEAAVMRIPIEARTEDTLFLDILCSIHSCVYFLMPKFSVTVFWVDMSIWFDLHHAAPQAVRAFSVHLIRLSVST